MTIMLSIVSQLFIPTTKKPVPNPIRGKTIPKISDNLILSNNKTPTPKNTMPKASIGKAFGSLGSLNIGRICKTPVMSKSMEVKYWIDFI